MPAIRKPGNLATDRAYASDQRIWRHHCRSEQINWLTASPIDIVRWISILAKSVRLATIERRIAAISELYINNHRDPPPTKARIVIQAMHDLRFELRAKRRHTVRISPANQKRMLASCGDDLRGLWERSIVMLLQTMRRDDARALVAKDVPTLEPAARVAVIRYMQAAKISDGFVLRPIAKGGRVQQNPLSGHSINRVTKRIAARCSISPELVSSESIRLGARPT